VSEATDQEMRSAVEGWARAKGLEAWGHHRVPGRLPWSVQPVATDIRGGLLIRRLDNRGETADQWPTVSPHAALVLALVLEARPLRDGSRCKRCCGQGFKVVVTTSRVLPCPDCEGTGLADLTDTYAQRVLDAQPQQQGNPAVYVWTKPGDPTSIEALHVLADRLQPDLLRRADGPPRDLDREALGLHLAILLAGSREGTGEAVEQLIQATGP
jgi:hypothetical protein